MKRIIVLLFLLCAYLADGQVTYQYLTTGESITGYARGALRIGGILYFKEGSTLPTPPAIMQNNPALIVVGNTVYRWSPTTKTWVNISQYSGQWGTISGVLTAQTDLKAALDAKQPMLPTGTTSQYFRGDKSLGTFANDVAAAGDVRYSTLDTAAAHRTELNYFRGKLFNDYYVTGAIFKRLWGVDINGAAVPLADWQDLIGDSILDQSLGYMDTAYKVGNNIHFSKGLNTWSFPVGTTYTAAAPLYLVGNQFRVDTSFTGVLTKKDYYRLRDSAGTGGGNVVNADLTNPIQYEDRTHNMRGGSLRFDSIGVLRLNSDPYNGYNAQVYMNYNSAKLRAYDNAGEANMQVYVQNTGEGIAEMNAPGGRTLRVSATGYYLYGLDSTTTESAPGDKLVYVDEDGQMYQKRLSTILAEFADGNNYPTSVTNAFNTTTRELTTTIARNGLANIVSTPVVIPGTDLTNYYTKTQSDSRYLQSYTETDAIALAKTITVNGSTQALSANPTFTIPDLNGIYSGSGSLAGNTTVATDSNLLSFTGSGTAPWGGTTGEGTLSHDYYQTTINQVNSNGANAYLNVTRSYVGGLPFAQLSVNDGAGTEASISLQASDGYINLRGNFAGTADSLLGLTASGRLVKVALASGSSEVYAPYTVTYSATPTFNYTNSINQEMTLTGNVTAITLSNIPDGKTMYIKFKQDATGSRTVSGWGANGKLIGGSLTLTTTGNAEDIVGIKRLGSNYYITYGKDYK